MKNILLLLAVVSLTTFSCKFTPESPSTLSSLPSDIKVLKTVDTISSLNRTTTLLLSNLSKVKDLDKTLEIYNSTLKNLPKDKQGEFRQIASKQIIISNNLSKEGSLENLSFFTKEMIDAKSVEVKTLYLCLERLKNYWSEDVFNSYVHKTIENYKYSLSVRNKFESGSEQRIDNSKLSPNDKKLLKFVHKLASEKLAKDSEDSDKNLTNLQSLLLKAD